MKNFDQLLQDYLNDSLSADELQQFFALFPEKEDALAASIQLGLQEGKFSGLTTFEQRERILAEIRRRSRKKQGILYRFWPRVAAACVFIAIAAWFVIAKTGAPKQPPVAKNQDIEAPTQTLATITLADGRTISLDSLTTLTQSGVTLIKDKNGNIVYNSSQLATPNSELAYNTLTNPRGSKVIDMTLSDGSHVWLNAGSSITYPIAFVEGERKISMTGEAYFEIAHDKSKPFFVSKGDMNVQVLGTKFNVNAYDDEENIKVTLLEGSVRVSTPQQLTNSTILKPGQQAVILSGAEGSPSGAGVTVGGVDVNAVLAWKNGLFEFNNASLPTIMRQIARWYDVQVVYQAPPGNAKFGGGISNQLPLSQVLKLLEANGVKYKVEGRVVTVF